MKHSNCTASIQVRHLHFQDQFHVSYFTLHLNTEVTIKVPGWFIYTCSGEICLTTPSFQLVYSLLSNQLKQVTAASYLSPLSWQFKVSNITQLQDTPSLKDKTLQLHIPSRKTINTFQITTPHNSMTVFISKDAKTFLLRHFLFSLYETYENLCITQL